MATQEDFQRFRAEHGADPKWVQHIDNGAIYILTADNYLMDHLRIVTEAQAFPDKHAPKAVRERAVASEVTLDTKEAPPTPKGRMPLREQATREAAKNPAVKRNRKL